MGVVEVPAEALWGASTQRAVENFPISSLRLQGSFIAALGVVKIAAARANMELGVLDPAIGAAIEQAAREVCEGRLDQHFVVDVFQTGSGTSTNMNANEVIANRALEILGRSRGERGVVHPNDHVNASQSSNDVFPSAIHIASYRQVQTQLLPALCELQAALAEKAKVFAAVVKCGRTHLQDAMPVTLGQEFGGYAAQLDARIRSISRSAEDLLDLALGGTAVGTGINAPAGFATRAIRTIAEVTQYGFREATDHFAQQSALDTVVQVSGELRTLAVTFTKIVNDLRWLSSGPRCNVGEIALPELQPGSSIMPGKVNPVVCESALMVCAHVIGLDGAVAICGQGGNFELNTMMPLAAYNTLEAIALLANTANNLRAACVVGITANEDRCREVAQQSLSLATVLAPRIGYDRAAEVAKRAYHEGRTVREVASEMGVLPEAELERVLTLTALVGRASGG